MQNSYLSENDQKLKELPLSDYPSTVTSGFEGMPEDQKIKPDSKIKIWRKIVSFIAEMVRVVMSVFQENISLDEFYEWQKRVEIQRQKRACEYLKFAEVMRQLEGNIKPCK